MFLTDPFDHVSADVSDPEADVRRLTRNSAPFEVLHVEDVAGDSPRQGVERHAPVLPNAGA